MLWTVDGTFKRVDDSLNCEFLFFVITFNVCYTRSFKRFSLWMKCRHSQEIESVDYVAVVVFMLAYITVFFLNHFAVLRLLNDGIMRNVLVNPFLNMVIFPGSEKIAIIKRMFHCNGSATVKLVRKHESTKSITTPPGWDADLLARLTSRVKYVFLKDSLAAWNKARFFKETTPHDAQNLKFKTLLAGRHCPV